MQEYFILNCENANLSGLACHQQKLNNSVVRMQEIADANSHLVSSLTVIQNGQTEPEGNFLEVTAGRYYFKQVNENINECGEQAYPCFRELNPANPDELANSFRVSGKVKHGRLTRFIFHNFTGGAKNIDLELQRTVAAVPLAVAIVIDLSLSVQSMNHYFKRLSEPPEPDEPKTSFYSYQYLYDQDPQSRYVIPTDANTYWNELEVNRPQDDVPWDHHFRDDYVPIRHYNDLTDYANYIYKDRHIEPHANANDFEFHYLINAHRSQASGYSGPEPFLSIIKGAGKVLDLIEARSVSGDSVTLVGYDNYIPWRYVVKRTTEFDYIADILDANSIMNDSLHPGYPNDNPLHHIPIDKNAPSLPSLLRLGFFPAPGKFTDTLQGLAMAANQISSGLGDVPTIKAVIHFTDGLNNCSSRLQTEGNSFGEVGIRCRDTYEYYTEGMIELKKLVHDTLAINDIALHTFFVGNAAHYLGLPDPNNYTPNSSSGYAGYSFKCLDDAGARSIGWPFVQGSPGFSYAIMQQIYDDKDKEPFYQAAWDAYVMTKMTGGRWGALLPVKDNCQPQELDCGSFEYLWQRITFDSLCRNVEQQVNDYIEDVILKSKTFAVVE